MEDRQIVIGGFYRHFKDKLYQVRCIAYHSETKEKMVVYQALYGDYAVYVRPYEMFMSEVDHEKYPEVTQKYRFEQVNPVEEPAQREVAKSFRESTGSTATNCRCGKTAGYAGKFRTGTCRINRIGRTATGGRRKSVSVAVSGRGKLHGKIKCAFAVQGQIRRFGD